MNNRYIPFLIAFILFVIASLAYFSPALEGKMLFQSDIAQFRGMSKEIVDYRTAHGEEPYWTNRAFGGMPAYQVSAYYPYNYIQKFDQLLRFLPRPADYVFLYFLSFFILLTVLKVEWKLAILGALSFGFSTYLIIIFGAGHNAKAHAIAYMPLVLAGILAVFKNRYLPGFVLTALGMALEINAGHVQMTYYLFFMVVILGIVYLIKAIKQKELMPFLKQVGILIVGVLLGIGLNATNLLATQEYAAHSTRSKSELTINPDGTPKAEITGGLSKEYITEYSYSIPETFNLLIPRFYGGGSGENLGTDSNSYAFLKDRIGRQQARDFSEHLPMYWGEQTIVEAPAYVGAVLLFLFLLGAFWVKKPVKKWLVAASVFAILLSWGKHFGVLTDFFIDYVPLYNKFRAVSSIQVIVELAVPLLAIITLHKLLSANIEREPALKKLKLAFYILGGITLFFTLFGTSFFSFESLHDAGLERQLKGFSEALIADRKSIFFKDSLRSFILIGLTFGVLWAYLKQKLNKNMVVFILAGLILFDLVAVDKRYLNADDFVSKRQVKQPFVPTDVDREILKDTSYYRVANFTINPMNDGSTSYFHNSIGGYHAAKPRRYQELFDYQISKNNLEVYNMLNIKYFIFEDSDRILRLQKNEQANGNAWFVNHIKWVNNADEEIKALDSLNAKETAVINTEFKAVLSGDNYPKDTTATITLTEYKPNQLVYQSNSQNNQLAVFSDMYYKNGWNAYVDGKLTPYIRVDYVLRAMEIPAGTHEVVFKFEPAVIQKGSTLSLISYVLLILISAVWFVLKRRKQ